MSNCHLNLLMMSEKKKKDRKKETILRFMPKIRRLKSEKPLFLAYSIIFPAKGIKCYFFLISAKKVRENSAIGSNLSLRSSKILQVSPCTNLYDLLSRGLTFCVKFCPKMNHCRFPFLFGLSLCNILCVYDHI